MISYSELSRMQEAAELRQEATEVVRRSSLRNKSFATAHMSTTTSVAEEYAAQLRDKRLPYVTLEQ